MSHHVNKRLRSETCRVWCRGRDRNGRATGLFWPCLEPAGHSQEHAEVEKAVHDGRKPGGKPVGIGASHGSQPTELHCYRPATGHDPVSDCDETLEERLRASIVAARVTNDVRNKKGTQ